MATLRTLKKVAATFRATVVDEKSGNCHCCRIEAPAHTIWAEGNVHEMVDEVYKPWKPDYADLIARMSYGLEVCPLGADCEWCNGAS